MLADAGLIRPDPLQLGLDVTERCLAVGADGKAVGNLYVAGLYVAGPLARGHIGELMGVPEVTAHAELVAARVAQQMVPRTPP